MDIAYLDTLLRLILDERNSSGIKFEGGEEIIPLLEEMIVAIKMDNRK